MTLYRFALIPKTCDICDRMFIFEKYFTFPKMVGIEQKSIKLIECKKCHEKNKNNKPTKTEMPKVAEELTCWKCGKVLNEDNKSSLMYLSSPPKYTCKEFDPPTKVSTENSVVNYTKPITKLISSS